MGHCDVPNRTAPLSPVPRCRFGLFYSSFWTLEPDLVRTLGLGDLSTKSGTGRALMLVLRTWSLGGPVSGVRGGPLCAFVTLGIGPCPHLDFAQFWDLRANLLGLCCVRWWAVPLLGHQTWGTGTQTLEGYWTLSRCRTGLVVPPDSNQGSFSTPSTEAFRKRVFS